MNPIFERLTQKEATLAVIGLGYVGLPIALEFAKKIKVIGFDINEGRIKLMQLQIDPSNELKKEAFDGSDIQFTSNIEDLKSANFYIVAVPTPVDVHNVPNLVPVVSASETIGKVIKPGDYVVYESTVYPGCTEDDCIPIIEKISGLEFKKDFHVGYSPERINPGDTERTIRTIIKIVSGSSNDVLDQIAKVYELVVDAGVYKAQSIKVAEAAKVIENTQRDLNIALMNELSKIFNLMEINTYDVLEAAGTKWNFLKFFPGLVGGHCIGVDPYYLTYKSEALGYKSEVILSGRRINNSMSKYIASHVVKELSKKDKILKETKVLILGATFKENVSDIRNSKIIDLYNTLKSFSLNVDIIDPHASSDEMLHEYNVTLNQKLNAPYDTVILAVNHHEYSHFSETQINELLTESGLFVDIKGVYRNQLKSIKYWSL